MSFDFALAKICSHHIAEEIVFLDETSRYFRFRRQPSNSDIKISVNGVIIPREGLFTKPDILFTSPGPYNIIKDFNDTIKIRIINSGAVINIKLPIGGSVSTEKVVSYINKSVVGHDLLASIDNAKIKISYVSSHKGPYFTVYDPRINDPNQLQNETHVILRSYAMFGITPGRAAVGRQISPGWKIISVPNSNYADPGVEFDEPLRNNNPSITLSYEAVSIDCGRCQGSLLEFDYSAFNGGYEELRDLELLTQESDKFLFTRRGSHFRWSWLGSDIQDMLGQKNVSGKNSLLVLSLDAAFKNYQNIKMQQSTTFVRQEVSDYEFPKGISNFSVVTDPNDPTSNLISLTILSRSTDQSSFSRSVSLRNPYDVIGANQQNTFGTPGGYILR